MSLYIHEAGASSAPTLVFLHAGGLSHRMWLPQIERLADSFHCLAPDFPEHGQSVTDAPLTMDRCIDALATLIRERVGKPAHVIGLSMGGAIGVTLLALCPELVDHLLISGTAQRLGKLMMAVQNLNAPILKMMSKDSVVKLMAAQFGIPADQTALIEDIGLLTPEAVMRTTSLLGAIDMPTDAPNPVLVCVGEKETGIAKNMARQYVKSLKQARGVIAPGGHVWNVQHPALFAETVRAFVTDSALPDALKPLD